jgi:hypothetical protein
LRRPRQHIRDLLSDTDSEDTAIPPAMFDDVMDSSYEFSAQRDVNLRGYQPISPTELADLGASSIQLSSSTSSIEDSYQCSHQSDIFLPKEYISLAEVASLQETTVITRPFLGLCNATSMSSGFSSGNRRESQAMPSIPETVACFFSMEERSIAEPCVLYTPTPSISSSEVSLRQQWLFPLR